MLVFWSSRPSRGSQTHLLIEIKILQKKSFCVHLHHSNRILWRPVAAFWIEWFNITLPGYSLRKIKWKTTSWCCVVASLIILRKKGYTPGFNQGFWFIPLAKCLNEQTVIWPHMPGDWKILNVSDPRFIKMWIMIHFLHLPTWCPSLERMLTSWESLGEDKRLIAFNYFPESWINKLLWIQSHLSRNRFIVTQTCRRGNYFIQNN